VLPDLVAQMEAWRQRVRGGRPKPTVSPEQREALQEQGYWGIVGEKDATPAR